MSRLNKQKILLGGILTLAFVITLVELAWHPSPQATPVASPVASQETPSSSPATAVIIPQKPPTVFSYTFNTPGILYEAGGSGNSTSQYWWVDSGAELVIANGVGSTIEGSLPTNDPWRILYAKNNPQDTDDGYHPQNIFRLVTQYEWTNYTQTAYFKIDANNLSASPNRNQSNGLLLFNRYQNAFNLYYAGVRVDGTAVIKKKTNGIYYTMAQNPIFPGTYDPVSAPNLIPIDTWIGIRTEVATLADGSVSIKLYLDVGRTGNWILAAQATDDGTQYGGAVIAGPAHLGIRTDFMDVEFSDYEVVTE